MINRSTIVLATCLTFASVARAQDPTTGGDQEVPPSTADTEKKPEMPSLFALRHYTGGDLATRSHLLGDWDGKRNELAAQGITFDIDVTQIFQLNARGGKSTNNGFRYSGSVDYTLKLDTARMGLWPAGELALKGETQFGQSINSKAGSLMSVNSDALFPEADEHTTTLTDVVFTQFFSEHFGIVFGKVDFRGGDSNVFAHSETTQFMNLSLLANPVLLPLAPYSALTAAVIIRPTDTLVTSFTMLDSFGSASVSGFDTAFHSPEGTAFINEWALTVKPFGLEGHQRFGIVYSTRDFTLLSQDARIGGPMGLLRLLASGGIDLDTRPDDFALYYNFDQYLYTEEDDPTQGIGLFGRVGWSNGEANPFEGFYSIGIGGKGIFQDRDNDTFGLGYYYLDMSDDLAAFFGMDTEQGIELYYNIEVTPWFHVTPDVQYIIDPGGGAYDDALAIGIRTQLSF